VEGLNVCLNTQTPLVQFLDPDPLPDPGHLPEPPDPADLAQLTEGVDYRFSPGGVTRMVLPLVRRLISDGVLSEAHWVALNPRGPETVHAPAMTLHNVALSGERLAAYGRVKETIWSTVHGLPIRDPASEMFWSESFSEFAYYNRLTAERIRTLDRRHDFDLFYIHDFQQLPVGQMLDTLKPKVFRWHLPFDASMIPDAWVQRLTSYFDSYDAIIVSTRRYEKALRSFGRALKVRRMYPYVDPQEYSRPPAAEAQSVCGRWGISPEDIVLLVVARMDPTKGQDRAIQALSELLPRHPRLRLVLAGNGSFSGARGGLGLSKSSTWRAGLTELAETSGVGPKVVFTGHVSQRELDCLYERCALTVLPSVNEGFGLVVVESWLHRKPPVVTDRAGIAELIRPGRNGLLFDPERPHGLSEQIDGLLEDPELGARLGRSGARTAQRCSIDAAVRAEGQLVRELVEG
jgi:glycosyltransferase involved in cell wall biosynthesis